MGRGVYGDKPDSLVAEIVGAADANHTVLRVHRVIHRGAFDHDELRLACVDDFHAGFCCGAIYNGGGGNLREEHCVTGFLRSGDGDENIGVGLADRNFRKVGWEIVARVDPGRVDISGAEPSTGEQCVDLIIRLVKEDAVFGVCRVGKTCAGDGCIDWRATKDDQFCGVLGEENFRRGRCTGGRRDLFQDAIPILTFGQLGHFGGELGGCGPRAGRFFGFQPRFTAEKKIFAAVVEEIPVRIHDILEVGAFDGNEDGFAVNHQDNRRSGAGKNCGDLRADRREVDRLFDFLEAGDHVIERDVERHGGVDLADFLLGFGFVLGIEGWETRTDDLDVADVDGSGADVGNRVGAPGNYAQKLLASGGRNRYRGVGYERAVLVPGF